MQSTSHRIDDQNISCNSRFVVPTTVEEYSVDEDEDENVPTTAATLHHQWSHYNDQDVKGNDVDVTSAETTIARPDLRSPTFLMEVQANTWRLVGHLEAPGVDTLPDVHHVNYSEIVAAMTAEEVVVVGGEGIATTADEDIVYSDISDDSDVGELIIDFVADSCDVAHEVVVHEQESQPCSAYDGLCPAISAGRRDCTSSSGSRVGCDKKKSAGRARERNRQTGCRQTNSGHCDNTLTPMFIIRADHCYAQL